MTRESGEPRCETCHFAQRARPGQFEAADAQAWWGFCRRFPPRVVPIAGMLLSTELPGVEADHWCGEYRSCEARDGERCEHCRFAVATPLEPKAFYLVGQEDPADDDVPVLWGDCRRHPPRLAAANGAGVITATSPWVSADDWCGQFEPSDGR